MMEAAVAMAFVAMPVYGALAMRCVAASSQGVPISASAFCSATVDGIWPMLVWVFAWFGIAIVSDLLALLRRQDSPNRP